MGRLFGSLTLAFSMYSILPTPRTRWEPENMRYVMACFPLVGLVCGGAVWGWLWLCNRFGFAPGLLAAGATALPVLLTGGIHLDGFCDTADALGSHAPIERRLEILKDPHIGAFGLIGCCLLLLLEYGLWCQYVYAPRTAALITLGYPLARVLSGLSVVYFPCAKKSGLVTAFADAAARRCTGAALLCGLVACGGAMVICSPVLGAAVIAGALLFFAYYRRMARQSFGGVTGDLAGWFLQLCEGLMLAMISVGGGLL